MRTTRCPTVFCANRHSVNTPQRNTAPLSSLSYNTSNAPSYSRSTCPYILPNATHYMPPCPVCQVRFPDPQRFPKAPASPVAACPRQTPQERHKSPTLASSKRHKSDPHHCQTAQPYLEFRLQMNDNVAILDAIGRHLILLHKSFGVYL